MIYKGYVIMRDDGYFWIGMGSGKEWTLDLNKAYIFDLPVKSAICSYREFLLIVTREVATKIVGIANNTEK